MAVRNQITLGDVLLIEVDSPPGGSILAPKGSIAVDSIAGTSYQNQGGTVWTALGGGGGALTSGAVTSGFIGNSAVVSGSIASGQIASGHLSTAFIAGLYANDVYASTRVVSPSGLGGTDTTIAAALAAIPSGGTVFLKSGVYNISSPLSVPANTKIIGAGRNSTIINIGGSITLFNTVGGHFSLSDVTVQGDNVSVQAVLGTSHLVDISCANFTDIYGLVEAVSSAAEVTMRDCVVALASGAGTGIYLWSGVTGGTLRWDTVDLTVPISGCTLIEGATPASAGCDWKVTQSVSVFAVATPNLCYPRSIDWVHFDFTSARVDIASDANKVTGCNFFKSSLTFRGIGNQVSSCRFLEGGGGSPSADAQLEVRVPTAVPSQTTIAGSYFDGNLVSLRGIGIFNSEDVGITGCSFSDQTTAGVSLASGTSPTTSKASVTGCRFIDIPSPISEGSVDCDGRYDANDGLAGSDIIGHNSLLDGENYRNVVSWGADASGLTDSTAAIQAAIDGLPPTGGTVFFPTGAYRVTATLALPDKPVTIKGSGDSSVIAPATLNMVVFSVPNGLTDIRNYIFEDFRVSGAANGPIGGALAISGPFQDMFASAPTLTGANGTVTGSTVGFTKEVGEPNHAGNAGGHSAWFNWTAPFSGICTIDTFGSLFTPSNDTLLAIYTGATVSTLTVVAENDDSIAPYSLRSYISFVAVSGTTYRIAVDGYNAAEGSVVLNMVLADGAVASSLVQLNDVSSMGNATLRRVNTEFVRNALDAAVGDTSGTTPMLLSMEDCWIRPLQDNTSTLIATGGSAFPVKAALTRVRFLSNFEAYQPAPPASYGGAIASNNFAEVSLTAVDCVFHIALDSAFGSVHMTNCYIKNIVTPTVQVFMFVWGSIGTPNDTALIDCVCENNIYWDFGEDAVRVAGGTYRDTTLVPAPTGIFGGSIVGAAFFLGPNQQIAIDGVASALTIDGCYFEEVSAVAFGRYIDVSQFAFGATNISNCSFGELAVGSTSAVRVVQSGLGNRAVTISNCWFDQPNVPPVIEQLTTSEVRYSNNTFATGCLPPTIIGTASTFNGARNVKIVGATQTIFFVDKVTHVNPKGVVGIGTLRNAGVNPLEVRETVIDVVTGATSSRTTTVTGGNSVLLNPQTNIGSVFPPYSSYIVAVRNVGISSLYDLCFTTMGAS
jgi:hypothetical protein